MGQPPTTNSYVAQNVSSAGVEKSCFGQPGGEQEDPGFCHGQLFHFSSCFPFLENGTKNIHLGHLTELLGENQVNNAWKLSAAQIITIMKTRFFK